MNLQEISNHGLFKFTGPPENWLTAIKFMTWGLTEEYSARWAEIEPGDIFLMHSMSTNTIVKNAKSSVIGFGVVGTQFTKKSNLLWLAEHQEKKNIWPLLVPFSEVYLFSQFIPYESLQAPDGNNNELVINESLKLLENAVPLSTITGFPQMGSTSSVKPEIVAKIFDVAGKFYLYRSLDTTNEVADSITKPIPLQRIETAKDTLRKATSLSDINIVKQKIITNRTVTYAKDNQLLERAEQAHFSTLEKLVNLMKSRGYTIYANRYIDLFATNGKASYLFEVKSVENFNFRSQVRKGIVQLLEYEYFEVRKYFEEQKISTALYKSLIMSQSPTDDKYVEFINSLKMEVGYFSESNLIAYGQGVGLGSI